MKTTFATIRFKKPLSNLIPSVKNHSSFISSMKKLSTFIPSIKLPLTFVLSLCFIVFSQSAHADSKYDQNVSECLGYWKNHPFAGKNPAYKTLSASVSVFGAGSDIVDDETTPNPSLVFIKPSVNVLGGKTIRLNNPNGWYCMKSNTNVLGKATIELHCKAKLAIANEGATVLGSDKGDQKGTTVLGKTKIKRINCD